MTNIERGIGNMVAKDLEASPLAAERAMEIMAMVGRLEGVQLDKKSEIGAATIGAAMEVYDAAFDKYDIRTSRQNAGEITNIINGIETSSQKSLDSKLKKAIELAHDNLNEAALAALKNLTKAQADSLGQRDGSADIETIKNITYKKGANTVLLFALEVSPDINNKRRVCYEELGYLVQLLDDYADKELDKKEGITTLATAIPSPEVINQVKVQYQKVRNLFKKEYEEHQIIELFNYVDKLMAKSGVFLTN
jgi:hypothetical protein